MDFKGLLLSNLKLFGVGGDGVVEDGLMRSEEMS